MSTGRARLQCSHCHQRFHYEYVPGGSFTAVRLAGRRYMRCPLCHRFGLFDLHGEIGTDVTAASPYPTYSDRQHFGRWLLLFLIPAAVLVAVIALGLHRPEPAQWAGFVGAGAIGIGIILLVVFGSISRHSPSVPR